MMEGKNIFYYIDGDKHEGNFRKDNFDGKGNNAWIIRNIYE